LADNIRNLAISEAQIQGIDQDIVLATIDAETSFSNILGDSGNALGPGQVWPKWHNDAFQYAANRYKIDWPSDLPSRQKVTLGNDAFATAVAVRVIGQVWAASRKDFRQFSLQYVGPKIPDWDYQRRYKIWLKYAGKGADTASYTYSSTQTEQSGNQINNQIEIPPTNYGVVANSAKFGNVLYGRKYRVIVSNKQGAALDVSQLRCTFRIRKTINQTPNFSEIALYNLSPDTENAIIQEGNRVIIEAGYEGEQYGLIFDGDVVQPIRDKEDATTYRLTLYSLDGDRVLNQGFVNFSVIKGQSARDVVTAAASKSKIPTQLGSISDGLSKSKLTRGKVMFGMMKDYLRQIAKTSDASFYVEDGKVNIIKMSDLPVGEIIDLSPESGLIGVPAQADLGVTFRCLLNPRIKIGSMVRIDNSLIRAQVFNLGQVPRNLDEAGIYRVISVDYIGDTRGDDWYTECTTVSQAGGIPGLMSTAASNPF